MLAFVISSSPLSVRPSVSLIPFVSVTRFFPDASRSPVSIWLPVSLPPASGSAGSRPPRVPGVRCFLQLLLRDLKLFSNLVSRFPLGTLRGSYEWVA